MNRKVPSFRVKLILYFGLFTVVIFSVLWLLQTVFLQTFYNDMLADRARSAAEKIVASDGNTDTMDTLAAENSLLIYLTDPEGNILYSTDEYKSNHQYEDQNDHVDDNPYRHDEELNYQKSTYRSLPEGYDDFLAVLKQNGVRTEYRSDSLYVYGELLSGDRILYLSATFSSVGGAAQIIRTQLLWVTALSLIVAFVLAYLMARRFSKPIKELSEQAQRIGEDDFSGMVENGFCSEINQLGETLIKTNDKLLAAKTYQQELLANVSHDLRTPLTKIKGYAEGIRDFGDDKSLRESDCEIIIRETERLSALVGEILEYSELQSDISQRVFQTLDLSKLVNEVIDRFEPLFEQSGGTFERSVENGIAVSGNAAQLERVVYNLIDNAVRHTGDSKKITVSLHTEGSSAVLTVQDYGAGIPREELPHIWERYYTYRQRNKKGVSGLGLAIVKQIVTLHGGKCYVESKEGEGCVFRVVI